MKRILKNKNASKKWRCIESLQGMNINLGHNNLQPAENRQPVFPRGGPEELASFMW